jgi:hypothetical protein
MEVIHSNTTLLDSITIQKITLDCVMNIAAWAILWKEVGGGAESASLVQLRILEKNNFHKNGCHD